jgi:hypothetical protein
MSQQQGKRVGLNISAQHQVIYREIETTIFQQNPKDRNNEPKLKKVGGVVKAKCSRGLSKNKYNHTHKGDRWLPIRDFAIALGSDTKLQAACRVCDHNYRVLGRSNANRSKFEGKSAAEIRAMYRKNYPGAGGKKTCSRAYSGGCLHPSGPDLAAEEFNISRGMETGLHNHCKVCAKASSGAVGDRFLHFLPDGKVLNHQRPKALSNCAMYPNKGGKRCSGVLHDDHIWPLAVGGSDRPINHQWLCETHNQTKSSSVDASLKTVSQIKPNMMSDRFHTTLAAAKSKKTDIALFHQEMRGKMTKERTERAAMSDRSLRKIFTDWKQKNNRKHNVERAIKKAKEFKVQKS